MKSNTYKQHLQKNIVNRSSSRAKRSEAERSFLGRFLNYADAPFEMTVRNLCYNLIFFLVLSIPLFFLSANQAKANSPAVYGKVVSQTGAPLTDYWVEWIDNANNKRYVKTFEVAQTNVEIGKDADDNPIHHDFQPGDFFFCSYPSCGSCTAQNDCLSGTMIDADNDGTNERKKVSSASNNCSGENHSCVWGGVDHPNCCNPLHSCCGWYQAFDCGTNPHKFQVIKHTADTGTFISQVKSAQFYETDVGNSGGELDLGVFKYTPPVPTNTPTPTPIPGTANCNCYSMTVAGTLQPGQMATFTTTGKVQNPATNPSEIRTMNYFLEKVNSDGSKIPLVGPTTVPASAPTPATGANYYVSSWSHPVPAMPAGTGRVTYRAYCTFGCNIKVSQLNTQNGSAVLGASDEKISVLGLLGNLIGRLFGIKNTARMKSKGEVAGAKSLQLGTFNPENEVSPGCEEVTFTVNYP